MKNNTCYDKCANQAQVLVLLLFAKVTPVQFVTSQQTAGALRGESRRGLNKITHDCGNGWASQPILISLVIL